MTEAPIDQPQKSGFAEVVNELLQVHRMALDAATIFHTLRQPLVSRGSSTMTR
jgi:hypothetical protein